MIALLAGASISQAEIIAIAPNGTSDQILDLASGGITTHPFHNTRGDVVAEFTAAGNLASHTTRQADGLPEDIFGTPTSHYGSNGKWQEPGQLVNDGFRHRDLHTATFLSRDPAGFIDGPNHYNYVAHNPWSAFDPHGLATTLQIPDGTNDIGYITTITC